MCPLRVKHPSNGGNKDHEFSLGCGACLDIYRTKEEKANKEKEVLKGMYVCIGCIYGHMHVCMYVCMFVCMNVCMIGDGKGAKKRKGSVKKDKKKKVAKRKGSRNRGRGRGRWG